MITENPDGGGYKFTVSYHFESNMRAAGERSHPTRVKRLAQEAVTLSTALPLSYSSSVFVRCDADRLDIMKVYRLVYLNPVASFGSTHRFLFLIRSNIHSVDMTLNIIHKKWTEQQD